MHVLTTAPSRQATHLPEFTSAVNAGANTISYVFLALLVLIRFV
jgi:hypothetical protein